MNPAIKPPPPSMAGFSMKEKGRFFKTVIVCFFFMGVLSLHWVLAQQWYKDHFILFFTSTNAFLDAVTMAYQKVAMMQCSLFDFSIFQKTAVYSGVGTYWPPLPFMLNLWTLSAFPLEWFLLPNLLCLGAIMLGIYSSAKLFCGDDFYSMLAGTIFSCYWLVVLQQVTLGVQLSVTACIVWGFYWYLRSEFFTRFWPSIFLGMFSILALYCDRVSPGVFILPFFLFPRNFRRKRSLLVMGLVIILIVGCLWPFYRSWVAINLLRASKFSSLIQVSPNGAPSPTTLGEVYRAILQNPVFLWGHLSFYFVSLTEQLLGYGFTGLFIVGAVFFYRLQKLESKIVWFALGAPLFLLTVFVKKSPVYIFPLSIYFALITGMGIFFIRKRALQYTLIGVILCLTALQYDYLLGGATQNKGDFLSRQFLHMRQQKIPNCAFETAPSMKVIKDKMFSRRIFSMTGQIGAFLSQSSLGGVRIPEVVIDFQDRHATYFTVFLLRKMFPALRFHNADSETPFSVRTFGDSKNSFLYVISDKKEYAETDTPREIRGCMKVKPSPEHRFLESGAAVYRLQRTKP